MSQSVPQRPNLEFDRKQAKSLLEALSRGDPEAVRRFAEHHPRGLPSEPRLTDAQLVVAREYGFPSWPAWKTFVETRGLDRKRQAAVVLRAVCSNDIARARVLLQSDPALSREDFYLACACGEIEVVEAHISRDPALVNRAGGVNEWEPIQYACFSRWLRCDPARTERIVAVVRRLLELGANPNAFHMTTWMDEPWKETVLFAASGIANHPVLTRLLLEAGADVNEQLPEPDPKDPKVSPWGTEVLYHTCEFRHTACLRLLLEAGPRPLCVSYCLARALDFENPEAAHLFLAHGADPNFQVPWAENRTHLHRAVQNGRSSGIVGALLRAGADPLARDAAGLTPYQIAVRYGQEDLAGLLESHGTVEATSEDRILGFLMQGKDAATCESPVHPDLLCAAARSSDAAAIARLIRAGAEIDACDSGQYGVPPLHWAAWRGRFDAVRALIEHGADIHWENPYGGDALGTAIHGSANCFDVDGGPAMRLPEEAVKGDYPQIVEYLISVAGARLPEKILGGSAAVQEVLRRHGVADGE
ncbi:MAG: ankyrin repeat domain-containing protein [Terrimicrobiaceae bacterium]|nr:ankyrin repeat domain-containing protein [Terrimicrobiaceae bacterium]